MLSNNLIKIIIPISRSQRLVRKQKVQKPTKPNKNNKKLKFKTKLRNKLEQQKREVVLQLTTAYQQQQGVVGKIRLATKQ